LAKGQAMKRVRAAIFTAVIGALAPAIGVAETLSDALVAAYRHSELIEKQRAVLRAADEDVAQAFATLKPVLDYTLSSARSFTDGSNASTTHSAQLSASLLLYDFGATRYSIERLDATVRATREGLRAVEQQVLLTAVQAYMSVLQARETVRLRRNNQRLLGEQLRATKDRFDVGEVTRTDVALAESSLAQSRAALVQAEGDLIEAEQLYLRWVGHKPKTLAQPGILPKTADTLDGALAIALRKHPAITSQQQAIVAADAALRAIEKGMMPQLRATGSLGVTDTAAGQNTTQSLGVNLSGRLYQGGLRTSQYRQQVARIDQARADLRNAVHDVSEEVANAWAAVEVSRAQQIAVRQQLRATQVAYNGVKEEASLGARTTLDVLDAEQDLLDAQTSLITTQANQYVAVYRVLGAMGLLSAQHLGLGVESYDPAAYGNTVRRAPASVIRGDRLDRVLRAIGKQ
jgi:outer membrane protein